MLSSLQKKDITNLSVMSDADKEKEIKAIDVLDRDKWKILIYF